MRKFFKSCFYLRASAVLLVCLLGGMVASCAGSSDAKKADTSPLDLKFSKAKADYDKGNWAEAVTEFEEVRIEGPASPLAAEATYLEAMARFKQELYSGAAVDFRALRRNYPTAPMVDRSQFMIGESYYYLSPRPELDQTYSYYALQEYQVFLRDFPSSLTSLKDSAQRRITELRNKLALKMLNTAELYVKLEETKSAMVYLNRVLDNYYDTDVAPEAQLRIAELAYDRNKIADAKTALTKFDDKFLSAASQPIRQRAMQLKAKL
jgi:outer membrane protein assembly factor BamD